MSRFEKKKLDADSLNCSLAHCECDDHTLHKLSQRCLTADLLAPRENDCSRMHSKVSSDWLQSYIKATQPFLEIFRMARYVPDRPRIRFPCYYFRLCYQGIMAMGMGSIQPPTEKSTSNISWGWES